jgi:CDP-6-deoxy-D-xylo-4-hexulose-3-dehydrase
MQTNIKWPLMNNNLLREDLDSVIELLKQEDPKLTNGPKVREFEEVWSEWLGVKYSVMLNSGASANDLTLLALKEMFGPSELIVPALTWVSDVASVLNAGHTPIFVDINLKTLGMATDLILKSITSKTKAVFLTHVLGFNALTQDLINELRKKNILLIEDVCESHGATHLGKKVGTFGWASNFSFYYAHHMTTVEGGMISTNDFQLYEMLRMMRSHGMVRESSQDDTKKEYAKNYPDLNPDFIFAYAAYNARNTEIGGIMGRSQLRRLYRVVERRTENLHRFLQKIDSSKYRTDFKLEGSSNYAFNLILKEPDNNLVERLMKKLRESGVEFRRGSAGGGNQIRQPYLKGIVPDGHHLDFPNTEHIHFYGFYIGNFPDLTNQEVDEICAIINSA